MFTRFVCALILSGTAFAILSDRGDGCAAIPRRGQSIRIANESAIIVWDAKTKTQHFIRRATFETASPDFGFLVPTPARPVLAEIADHAFRTLDDLTRPKVEERSGRIEPIFCCCFFSCAQRKETMAPAVRVLDTQTVGGFDTAVLEADDADALTQWLATNGYPSSPGLMSWVAPYLAEHWKITAFKIAQDPKTGRPVQSSAVRMTFHTDRPYFPYREPEEKASESGSRRARLLRIFFVGDTRFDGQLGTVSWHAEVPWANRMPDDVRTELIAQAGVPPEHVCPEAWLTTFEDPATARPGGEDVYFTPVEAPTPVVPRPIIHQSPPVLIPIELVVLGILFVGWLILRRARRRLPPEAA
jgi:hypothetical protein